MTGRDQPAATTAGLALLVAIWDAHQAILNAPRQKADNDREAMRLLEGLYALLAGLTRLEPEYDGGCDEQDGTSSMEALDPATAEADAGDSQSRALDREGPSSVPSPHGLASPALVVRSYAAEADLNLAGLVRYRDALRRIVDELGVPGPETPASVSNAYAIAHFALSGANSAEETERLVANAD